MTKELKGFLAKYDITYLILSKVLGLSVNTIGNKMRKSTFTQTEISKLLKYFAKYDNTVDSSIFFN